MGFESFNVRLLENQASFSEAVDAIMDIENAAREEDAEFTTTEKCFLIRGDDHAIELEVMGEPASISCRFTLCHPATIDDAFLAHMRDLMEKLDMRVKICDDVTPEHEHAYSLERFDDFASACRHYIAVRRREWQAMFGEETIAATTVEAHEHIIMPHYFNNVHNVRFT